MFSVFIVSMVFQRSHFFGRLKLLFFSWKMDEQTTRPVATGVVIYVDLRINYGIIHASGYGRVLISRNFDKNLVQLSNWLSVEVEPNTRPILVSGMYNWSVKSIVWLVISWVGLNIVHSYSLIISLNAYTTNMLQLLIGKYFVIC